MMQPIGTYEHRGTTRVDWYATMTDPQPADPIAILAERVSDLTAAVERIGGYAPAEAWTWVECDGEGPLWEPLKPRDGAEPLRIEVRADLLNYQVEAVPLGDDVPTRDAWPFIARHIRAWNVKAENVETGEWEDAPPPRTMGPDAFRYVSARASTWMTFVVKYAAMRTRSFPKESPPSAGTPSPPSEPALASSAPAKPSRRNPRAST